MSHGEHCLFSGFIGAILMACAFIASEDWRASRLTDEQAIKEKTCMDTPDSRAYMARLPGDPHTDERCIRVMRFGDPRWVPDFQHPLKRPK